MDIRALAAADWIQGGVPEAWEPGKLYLIECWASWCGPAMASIPQFDRLHDSRAEDGLRLIGMNVREVRPDDLKDADDDKRQSVVRGARKRVAAIVENRGAGMSYPVAFAAPDSAFERDWLEAAGIEQLPHAFVVKDGKLLLSTHPSRLSDAAVAALLEGGELQRKVIAEIGASSRDRRDLGNLMLRFRRAQRADDAKGMRAAVEGLEKLDPKAPFLPQMRLDLAVAEEDWDAANAIVADLASSQGGTRMLVSLATRADRDPDRFPAPVRKSLAAKLAGQLGEDSGSATSHVVLARLQWKLGDKDAALASARTALARAGDLPAEPFEMFIEGLAKDAPPPVSDVLAGLRVAMQKDAEERARNTDKEVDKAIRERNYSKSR